MYSNISQTLLLYKTWGYFNKFDSTKPLGAFYRCVKIPQYGYLGHGLKHITHYAQKHLAGVGMCHNPALVRERPLGAPAYVKWNWSINCKFWYHNTITILLHAKYYLVQWMSILLNNNSSQFATRNIKASWDTAEIAGLIEGKHCFNCSAAFRISELTAWFLLSQFIRATVAVPPPVDWWRLLQ